MEEAQTSKDSPASVPEMDRHSQTQVLIKGKRSKRQRLTIASSSSTTDLIKVSDFGNSGRFSPANSSGKEDYDAGEEEEEMANCLILLAQGDSRKPSLPLCPIPLMITAANKTQRESSFYVYQCKTCDRCFSSFQALGGHRASHKKLKMNPQEEIKKPFLLNQESQDFYNSPHVITNTTLSLQVSNSAGNLSNPNNNGNKSKVHECSICGAEFSSGQALGGHMRRHRSISSNTSRTMNLAMSTPNQEKNQESEKKLSRNVLSLDLNLPPANPDQEDHDLNLESKFNFASKQVITFSASPLVDCHY